METNNNVQSLDKKMRTRKILSYVLDGISIIIFIVVLFIAISTLTAKAQGKKYVPFFGNAYIVPISDSMVGNNPDSFNVKDLLKIKILDEKQQGELKEGDVITFEAAVTINNELRFDLVTHRIVENDKVNKQYITRGDADAIGRVDENPVKYDEVVGQLVKVMPNGGEFFTFINSFWGFGLVIVLPSLLVVAYCAVMFIMNVKAANKEKNDAIKAEQDAKIATAENEKIKLEAEKAELLKRLEEAEKKQ
ncbi:MAG: hypothetical protein RR054_01210 [Clostridia bacterium]